MSQHHSVWLNRLLDESVQSPDILPGIASLRARGLRAKAGTTPPSSGRPDPARSRRPRTEANDGGMTFHARSGRSPARQPAEPASFDPVGLLDRTRYRLLHGDDVATAIDALSDGLRDMRDALPAERWLDIVGVARAHKLTGLLHEDPLLRRAFVKPRGFPGDAPLLDMVHAGRADPEADGASPLGHAILDRNVNAGWAVAIRERRDTIAGLIDTVAGAKPMPHVLAVGCGHLREAFVSEAVRAGRVGRLVALDRDPEALAVVARHFSGRRLETVKHDVAAGVDCGFEPASFDLIYVSGACETLPDGAAMDLTRGCFDLLRPGGRLMIANLAPTIDDAGYLEAFGDWFMTYRDAGEMMDLAALIEPGQATVRRVYTRQCPEISYLEIHQRISP